MSFNQSEHIGRPAPGVKKAKGIYKISCNHGVSTIPQHEIISNISFGNPFIQVSGGASYTVKLTGLWRYRATFVSPTPTTLRVRLRDPQTGTYHYTKTESHTEPDACADCPTLTIAPAFVLNSAILGSNKRLNLTSDQQGGSGRTACLKESKFEMLFILNSGSITTIRNGELWNGNPVTVEQIT